MSIEIAQQYIGKIDVIAQELNEKANKKRATQLTNLDKVSLRLFERVIGNYSASIELYNKGFYPQVGILTRSIFEDYLNILYLHRTPELDRGKLATRYLDYATLVEPYIFYEKVKDLATVLDDVSLVSTVYSTERIAEIETNKQTFTTQYNNSIKSWSGLDFASSALKAGERDKYFKYYSLLSNVTHGSPLGNFTEDKISVTNFLSITSFVALADLMGENEIASRADEVKEELINEPGVFI